MSKVRCAVISLIFAVCFAAACAAPLAPSGDYIGMSRYEAVCAEAAARGIALSDAEMQEAKDAAKADFADLQMTEEAGRYTEAQLLESHTYEMLFDKLSLLFVPETDVSSADVENWYGERLSALENALLKDPGLYKNQQEQFDRYGGVPPLVVPDGYVRFHHILLADRAEAEAVHARLVDGADFFELMRDFGIDEGMRTGPFSGKGYLLGTPDSAQDYYPEIKSAVLALKEIGAFSDVVESPAGYSIVRLSEKVAPGTRPLSDVKSDIETLLANHARARAFDDMLAEWTAKSAS